MGHDRPIERLRESSWCDIHAALCLNIVNFQGASILGAEEAHEDGAPWRMPSLRLLLRRQELEGRQWRRRPEEQAPVLLRATAHGPRPSIWGIQLPQVS